MNDVSVKDIGLLHRYGNQCIEVADRMQYELNQMNMRLERVQWYGEEKEAKVRHDIEEIEQQMDDLSDSIDEVNSEILSFDSQQGEPTHLYRQLEALEGKMGSLRIKHDEEEEKLRHITELRQRIRFECDLLRDGCATYLQRMQYISNDSREFIRQLIAHLQSLQGTR